METKQITKEEILAIPAFNLVFAKEEFTPYLDTFISDINKGKEQDIKQVLGMLIEEYSNYCGISKGYRTVFYDFAGELLQQHTEFWNEEEKESGYAGLLNHFKDFYTEYDNELDEYDIAVFEDWQYMMYGLELLIGNNLNKEVIPAYSFAMYSFINNYFTIFNTDINVNLLEQKLDEQFKERKENAD